MFFSRKAIKKGREGKNRLIKKYCLLPFLLASRLSLVLNWMKCLFHFSSTQKNKSSGDLTT